MKPEEVIFYTSKDISSFESIVEISVRKALISLCFFGDAFSSDNVVEHVTQTIKSRICGKILSLFAKENKLEIDFEHDQFPYWKSDHYDFSYQNIAWNFRVDSIHSQEDLTESEILKLPALVPNRFEDDIWNGRNEIAEPNRGRKFLFSFIYENEWTTFRQAMAEMLTPKRLAFLKKTAYENLGWNLVQQSFNENKFWNEFDKEDKMPEFYFEKIPILIICGTAGKQEFSFFADTDSDSAHGYSLFSGRYYEHIPGGGGLSFLNGRIKTHIRNATCPMQTLPSFQSTIRA